MLLALVLLGSVPTLSVAKGSDCAKELRAAGLTLVESGAVELSLRAGPKNRLTLRRGTQLVLSRDLGPGTCDEAGRAAGVIVERWETSLAPPVVKPVPLEPIPEPVRAPSVHLTRVLDAGTVTPLIEPPVLPEQSRGVSQSRGPGSELASSGRSLADAGPSTPLAGLAETAPSALAPTGERETAAVSITPLGENGAHPASEVEGPPVIADPEVKPTAPPPLRITVTHLEAFLGGGLAFPAVTPSVGPVVSADLALVLNHRVRVGVTGLFDFGGTPPILDEAGLTRGTFTSRGGAVLPGAAFCFDFHLRACAGLLVGARMVEGQAAGPYVFQQTPRVRGAFAFGPSVQLAWLPGAFHLGLEVSLLVTPVPPDFTIEGLAATLAPVPLAQGMVRLSIGLGTDR